MAKPLVFVVSGREQPAVGAARGGGAPEPPLATFRGHIKQSVRVGAGRGRGAEVRLVAEPGRDIVVLRISGGPALYLTPESASDLIRAQARFPGTRAGAHAEEESPIEGEIRVPARLQWRGLERTVTARGGAAGGLGDVLLDSIHIITDAAAGLAADVVVRKVDEQVNEGIYRLRRDELPKLKDSGAKPEISVDSAPGRTALVLVHGTFANTALTFDKLWKDHPEHVAAIFDHYQDRVYALDHRTLGVSPISNALTLAKALKDHARVDLLTHSRGGLVAEVFVRACASRDLAADLKFFAGKGYEQHKSDMKALQEAVAGKDIQVGKVVRVACPARGTLLASKRLDAYLSVFKWSLQLAGIPVVPAIADFLAAVATRKEDPAKIPGLSVQIPDNPLIKWLYSAIDPIPGDLRVVAGDIEGDSVLSWVKTLVADSFYWTDNDLVVQTRSMYGGVPRDAGGTFVLDQGGKVSHFGYFSNETTAAVITNALADGDTRKFRPIGPKSWAGEDSSGARAPAIRDVAPASDKPAVFVLPGILGSNLKVGSDRIWLSPRIVFGLKKLAYSPGKDKVSADGPLGLYDDLSGFLAETHEVIEFGYDWRRPLEDEARRLADAVEAALAARERNGLPVRFVAHSMGGLLARTMLLERPQVWKAMMARTGARVLMLGTPNGGSWAPMQVLSGDDSFGNLLVALGAPFAGHEARTLMAAFPGFIQLQAGLQDASLKLASAATWKKFAADDVEAAREQSVWHNLPLQLDAYEWGIPTQDALDRAAALRTKLDAQRDTTLAPFADRIVLVVGESKLTPDGYDVSGKEGLVYLNAQAEGDGRVTWTSARLPGVKTWKLDCEHGKLPEEKAAYGAYLELLQQGTTEALPVLQEATASRGPGVVADTAPAHVRSRPSRGASSGRPPTVDRDLLAPSDESAAAPFRDSGSALHITVTNGDLKFVRQPLMLGHYRSMRLTGTEAVMDRLIGRSMSEKVKAGSYPDAPGSNHVFTNRWPDADYPGRIPRPEAVIVAGLGPEGELRAVDLVHTVRQAVIEWSQRESEKPAGGAATFDLASTLIGSGGSGISVGQSAQLIAQGVREANERLARIHWPVVGHLRLIELYLDRATEAWRSLQVQASSTPSQYAVASTIEASHGAMKRPLESGYRGADYDLVSAISDQDASGAAIVEYTLDTKRARTEIRAQATQGPLLRRLVEAASNDSSVDDQIGRTLFRLLVPVELEPFLGGSTEIVIELDSGTAGIPWELLDANVPGSGDRRPWAIRSKLIRKLRTSEFRRQVVDAGTEERILVIGEPMCDPKRYSRLPGARAEASAIVKRLTAPGAVNADKVTALISPDDEALPGPDARTIINALMARDWRIVHVSGHGEPPVNIAPESTPCSGTGEADGDPRGVVLSECSFLGPREIENMRVVPELVFVNCCHLAARNTGQLVRKYDRARFAATVAEKLIGIGVRCVIAAGWAVDDTAASTFATTFYDRILRGRRFLDAVAESREAAQAAGGNTWGAYQCYGDPDWIFRREAADAQGVVRPLNEFAGIASSTGLENALETLRVESKYQGRTGETQRVRLRFLEDRFAAQWGGTGSVAAAFAIAWDAFGDRASAIKWYERAVAAQDGTAPTSAIEQLANLRVREAWEAIERAQGETAKRAGAKTSNAALIKATNAALNQIDAAIELLNKLVAIAPSIERTSLLASAYKRRARVQRAVGKRTDDDIAKMKACYVEAETRAREAGLSSAFYPMLNVVAADLILRKGARKPLAPARIRQVRQILEAAMRDDPEFWAAAGEIELTMYEALASGEGLRGALEQLEARYRDLNARVKAKSMWQSVYDQASFALSSCVPARNVAEQRAALQLLKLLRSFV
jgi:pimeloyl-ACP methyl ester carboxylesterase/tetratricopeptide (TPR) repeat protein